MTPQQSEDRFRLLFDGTADALFLHDLDGRFVEVNQAACNSLGYTREELLQQNVLEIEKGIGPEGLAELSAKILQGQKCTMQGLLQRQDGTIFPVEVHLSPFEYAGRPHILASARDISERLRYEEALRTSEAFLNSIIEQSPYPMSICDDQGTLIRLNRACRDLLHISPEEVLGKYNVFQDNIIEEQGVLPLLQRVFERGETVKYEIPYDTSLLKTLQLKSSTAVILDVTVSPIKDGSGKITNAVFQHVDITHRKRAEAALAESKQRFSTFMDHLPAAIFIKDQAGRLLFANRYLRETFGWEDCVGKTTEELLPPELAVRMVEDDRRVLTEGPRVIQERIVDIQGEEHFFDTYKFPVTAEGAPVLLGGIAVDITDRKRAEEALRESEERYRSLFQNNHSVMLLIEPETGAIMDANPAACAYYGFSKKELLAKKTTAINTLPPEQVLQEMERAKTEKRRRFEFRHRLASGKIRDVEVFSGPIRIKGQELLFSIVHDITARKEAQKALRESEKKYRTLFQDFQGILNTIPDGLSLISPDLKIVWGNEAAAFDKTSLSGTSGQLCYSFRQNRSEPCEYCPVVRCFRSGKLETEEIISHGRIWELRAVPIYDDRGELRGAIEVARDISDRKRAEEALEETNEALQALIQSSPGGIIVLDPDGNVKLWNQTSELMFGWSAAEVMGKFLPYVTADKREEHRMLREQVLRGEAFTGIEVRRQRKDGSPIDISVSTAPLHDAQRNIVGIMSVNIDITERKRAEEERGKLEAQMREVQKLESLGVLAGGIAHDFNNLLMAILGNADLALHSLSPASPARPNVEEIAHASQRAADLCRQMLAYSGKGRFVVGRYDLSDIVREMAQILNVSVSKQASLRYSFAADLPAVEVDATQMRQIIMNLITNASEAIGEEGGVISISTGVMDCDRAYLSESYLDENLPEGSYVYLEVSDNGSGMDEETRRRIFDPFYTTKFTGRGLGLAAVLGIVRGHRGAIKVYSEPGRGTTFKVLLPAVAWEPGDRMEIAKPEALPHCGGTVLLIDDERDVSLVASEMLTRLGFKVITAAHGREGLEIFKTREGEIDCVLLDLTMPGMGGEEAFRELRRLRRDVKVILSSGYNEQDVTQRFVGKGLAGFIQKPYTVAKLQEVLSQVFG